MQSESTRKPRKARAVMESRDGGETFGEVRWDLALPEPICQAGAAAAGPYAHWDSADEFGDTNLLVNGETELQPFTGMTRSSGIPVNISPAA